jgi:CheY-like chemotaxis protein
LRKSGHRFCGYNALELLSLEHDAIRRFRLIASCSRPASDSVLEAEDGPSAMRVLRAGRRLALLITDVGLPSGMNGRQVADAARLTRPKLKVLFVTGFAENAAIGNGHLPTGMEVITKPFHVADLAAKVAEIIAS